MKNMSNTYIHNPKFGADADPAERSIHPNCVLKMEDWKFERRRKYFERLIGTECGANLLAQTNGEEKLWDYAVKAEAQERFELTLTMERHGEALDRWMGDGYDGDPRNADFPKTDWSEAQLFLWERGQYEEMMERKGVDE